MATWSGYLTDYNATGPTKRIAARIRPILWNWIETAFDFEAPQAERRTAANRFLNGYNAWSLSGWLGQEMLREHVPSLLAKSKSPLLGALQTVCKSDEGLHRQDEWPGNELFAALWLARYSGDLAVLLAECQTPAELGVINGAKGSEI